MAFQRMLGAVTSSDVPAVLLINGVSGTGKTTVASALAGAIHESVWIHPDGLWDTSRMRPESILDRAIDYLAGVSEAAISIVDCQIRVSSARVILSGRGVRRVMSVLLTCHRDTRERRLLDRGWDDASFEAIERWAQVLLDETLASGDLIVDTSEQSTTVICARVIDQFGIRSGR
jgi:broad-specificity NMP kinase